MYKILEKRNIGPEIFEIKIEAPLVAKSAKPGQFCIIKLDKKGERIPLTICDYDTSTGSVTLVVQAMGESTKKMVAYEVGEYYSDFVAPLGHASEFITLPLEELKNKKILFIAGGVGVAPVYPQIKWLYEHGVHTDIIIGGRSAEHLIYIEELSKMSTIHIATNDGSLGTTGLVTDVLDNLMKSGRIFDEVITIGPLIMMKFVALKTKEYHLKTIASLNTLMVDGTGMCGACRVTVGGKTCFACVDGPEFDAHEVNFDEALNRQGMYKNIEKRKEHIASHLCNLASPQVEESIQLVNRQTAVPVRNQEPGIRVTNFSEVCYGYNEIEAKLEASRCLKCKNPLCVQGCPVSIQIPKFIEAIESGEYEKSAEIIFQDSTLPAICGRVCPQETQCEGKCILGIKGQSISIGKLERFIGDFALKNPIKQHVNSKNGKKIAVIGSGPSGLTCAGELAKKGFDVVIFEALHQAGGVLEYGIPEFRLPKTDVVQKEIENIKKLGVSIATDIVIGKTLTLDDILENGFDAAYISSGAGLPKFMYIPGENSNGVVSANEFLTRINLMKAYMSEYSTPVHIGKNVVVIGGGNVAMDAARTAKRLGSKVSVVYRRTKAELPARHEEIEHAIEEGIEFRFLRNPVEFEVENGWVNGVKVSVMELGEPDSSGRRTPVVVEGKFERIEADSVIIALGTTPNKIIPNTTLGLEVNIQGTIVIDEFGRTTKVNVYAGGDATLGAATVILAMQAGKIAAETIAKDIL